jgi:hypothetical protein
MRRRPTAEEMGPAHSSFDFTKEFTMPIRFSTQAANADILGDDTETTGAPDGMPQAVGADGTPWDRSDRKPQREGRSSEAKDDEAKPGKDINAAGFVKDKDAGKP